MITNVHYDKKSRTERTPQKFNTIVSLLLHVIDMYTGNWEFALTFIIDSSMYVYICYMCFVVCIYSAAISTIILHALLAKTLVIVLFIMSATHIAKCICRKHIIVFTATSYFRKQYSVNLHNEQWCSGFIITNLLT